MVEPPPDPDEQTPKEKPWAEESTEDYGKKAAKQIPYRSDPPDDPIDIVFEGECPRCDHLFVYRFPLEVVRGVELIETPPVPVSCQCAVVHPGRPENFEGCGAYWNVWIPGLRT